MSDFWSDPSSTSILRVRIATALMGLCGCAGSPASSLVTYVISTITSWADSFCALDLTTVYHLFARIGGRCTKLRKSKLFVNRSKLFCQKKAFHWLEFSF